MSDAKSAAVLTRRLLIGGLLGTAALAASPALANAPGQSLRPRPRGGLAPAAATPAAGTGAAQPASAAALIEQARLGGQVSYAVLDARSGELLEARGETQALPPASVAKAVTALFALDRLGAGFRFATRVLATGPVSGGRVQGDLILAGGGDPTLDTDRLADLAIALKNRGIRGITGRFLLQDNALPGLSRIDAGQPLHVGYNPAISGLNLNFNRVHMEWKRASKGWQIAMDARGARHNPAVRIARAAIAERQSPIFTFEERDGTERWTVASAALGKGGSRWLPVRRPAAYAGEVFQTLCAAQGITLPNPRQGGGQGTVVAETLSPPLVPLLRDMLRHSTNLTAEVVGLTASGQTSLRASAAMMNAWVRERHGVDLALVDHSGLGGDSRVSALAMARLMLRNPQLTEILRPYQTPAKAPADRAPVLAKTGTLNFVSGLAGHVQTRRPLAFAIFSADTPRRDALRGDERERPRGGPEWTTRARTLQGLLLERWAAVYGA